MTPDLSDWGSAGNVLGQSQVWIAFIYQSDQSNTYEGAYVDQVSLTTNGGGGGSNCGTYVLTEDNDNNTYTGISRRRLGLLPLQQRFQTPHRVPLRCQRIEHLLGTTAAALPRRRPVHRTGQPGDRQGLCQQHLYRRPHRRQQRGLDDHLHCSGRQHHARKKPGPNRRQPEPGHSLRRMVRRDHPGPAHHQRRLHRPGELPVGGQRMAAIYAPGATVAVTYEIDTTATSQQIRVESNLVNPDGVIVAGTERNYTTSGSANDPKTVNLALPATAAGGAYKAQVLVFDATTGQLESTCEAPFTVTGGGGSCDITCSTTVPTTAVVGQTVNFNSTASASGDCGTVEYFWSPRTRLQHRNDLRPQRDLGLQPTRNLHLDVRRDRRQRREVRPLRHHHRHRRQQLHHDLQRNGARPAPRSARRSTSTARST